MLVGTVAALGWRHEADAVIQAQCGNTICRAGPTVCRAGCGCCVFGNGNTRCMPPDQCARLRGEITCPEGLSFDSEVGGCVDPCPAGTQCATGMVCSDGTCVGNGVCIAFGPTKCSATCGTSFGVCDQTSEGAAVCTGGVHCDSAQRCNSSAERPSGYTCEKNSVGTLCNNVCRPFCDVSVGISALAKDEVGSKDT